MKPSFAAIELIKKFEGFEPRIYKCPAGKATIGYGHMVAIEEFTFINTNSPISEHYALELLKNDLIAIETAINLFVKVPLTQGQYDALVSLIYNWGAHAFKTSKGFKKLNIKDYIGASKEFFDAREGVVRINGNISQGLVNRRRVELTIWNG